MPSSDYIIYPDQTPGWEDTLWKFKKGAWTGEDIPIGHDTDIFHAHIEFSMTGQKGTENEWTEKLENGSLYYRTTDTHNGLFCGYIAYNNPTTNQAQIYFGSWWNNSGTVTTQYTGLSSGSGTLTLSDETVIDVGTNISYIAGVNYGATIGLNVAASLGVTNWQVGKNQNNEVIIDADFPIFDSWESLVEYIKTGSLDGCINLTAKYEDNSSTYYIYCKYQSMDLLNGTQTPHTGSSPAWHSQRFMANKEPALYFTGSTFELGLLASQIVASKAVSGPGYMIDYSPMASWTEGELEYTGKYYATIYDFRAAKGTVPANGTYTLGTQVTTNIPIYKNITDARSGDKRKAINYYDIEDGKDRRKSTIGDEEDSTDFGDGMVTSPFVAMYLLSRTQVLNIAGLFYTDNTSLLDNIKAGLELFGASPYEAVVGVNWFPFNVSLVCTTISQPYIYFGSYKYDQITVDRIATLEGAYIDAGTVTVNAPFGSYRDFEPYSELSVWLPYHGWEKLEIKKYINKTVNIRYYVDITTCTAIIALVVDNHLCDQFSCNIGVQLPLCGNNLSEYANNMIRSILTAGVTTVGGAMSGAMVGGGVPGAIIGGGLGLAAGVAKGTFEMAQKPKPKDMAVTKGAFAAGAGSYMPQYVRFRIDTHDIIEPENLTELYGRPSSSSGPVSSFSGFLKVNTIKLNTGRMTDAEVSEITSLLESGIYV